mmetsp:Transcript_68/g.117  ORF Transcript_68/g.117 Transcript_68/m.117 type:complete len:82 (+) Transcript_68:2686-2931(+)
MPLPSPMLVINIQKQHSNVFAGYSYNNIKLEQVVTSNLSPMNWNNPSIQSKNQWNSASNCVKEVDGDFSISFTTKKCKGIW